MELINKGGMEYIPDDKKTINKFQLKENVWLMHDNKPIEGMIRAIVLSKSEEVVYTINIKVGVLSLERTEDKLFNTKEKLLKSL